MAALLALVVALIPAAWRLRKTVRQASGLIDRVSAEVRPLTARATRVVDDVQQVTATVRTEVARASAALTRVEARARDLEALLDVAQRQAEQSLVAAASTVAGVREGFAALRGELAGGALDGADDDLPDDEFLDADAPDDTALVDVHRPGAEAARPRPRVRGRDA